MVTANHADEAPQDYEPPHLETLGTIEELTQGIVPTSVDSVLPGSLN